MKSYKVTTSEAIINEPALTAEEIAIQKNQYDEQLRLYNETRALEVVLRAQVIEAIDEEYLTSLRN